MAFTAMRRFGGFPAPELEVYTSPSEHGRTYIGFAASWEMLWGPDVGPDVRGAVDLFAAAVCDELREDGFAIEVPGFRLPSVNRPRLRTLDRVRRAVWRAVMVAALPIVVAAVVLFRDNELLLWSILAWLAMIPLLLVYFRWRIIGMRMVALGLYIVFMLVVCVGLTIGGIAIQLWG